MAADTFPGPKRWPRWWRRLSIALRRSNIYGWLEVIAGISLVGMGITSWFAVDSRQAESQLLPSTLAASLLVGTLVPAMALIVLVGRRAALRRAQRNIMGSTGRLHVQLVWLFSLVAAVPTLLVVLFASLLFQSGVEFWFSDNSRGMLENANKLARGYYEQNLRDVGNETVAMAGDLRDYLSQAKITSPEFAEGYSFQVVSRRLNESAILQRTTDGKLLTAAIVDPEKDSSRTRISPETLRKLDAGEQVVVSATASRIEGATAIDAASGVYLYAARSSDALALSQWERAQGVLKAYDVLTQRARNLQLRFNLALLFISLALVALSVWFALRFADRQVAPLAELVSAARTVGSGNFAMRVPHRSGADEIGLLNRAFNRMTEQIDRQTRALVGANAQLEDRRAFIEAVVESISAGIISVDEEGMVRLINSSAIRILLGRDGYPHLGQPLAEFAPQLASLVDAALSNGVVQYNRGGELLTLAVKIAKDPIGHVITFEDITRQLLDQRQAAWSDVARRIAHEIKNPLTPIQLATERLRRRYGKQIQLDPELFDELIDTIIRQVGDLRKMVDEFSSFARLPKPVFRSEDAGDLVRQAVFLQEVGAPGIDFRYSAEGAGEIECDRHQFGQAMTNVLKNAVEAIEARQRGAEPDYRGRISVDVRGSDRTLTVKVADNGIGLPQDRERIVEPYVTTREKGTGLGLAIVNKIVEEHGGEMTFATAPEGGAEVTLTFARSPLQQGAEREAGDGRAAAE
ncbi:ATP-binding protein [Novosphingobium tardum]|uniref:histidine kinase n=1 Tax=Novosphingobium tardum TaxID=1538021 RepID=A0ABV8RPF1_9SPHN